MDHDLMFTGSTGLVGVVVHWPKRRSGKVQLALAPGRLTARQTGWLQHLAISFVPRMSHFSFKRSDSCLQLAESEP
jgi:hypothetical protein